MTIFSKTANNQYRGIFIFEALMLVAKLLLIGFVGYFSHSSGPVANMSVIFVIELSLKVVIYRLATNQQLSFSTLVFSLLLFDVVFLAGYLYFIGGATNALISFLLLPVAISAILLSKKQTWFIAILSVACYTLLMEFNLPLMIGEMSEQHHNMASNSHFWGMWGTFFISTLVLTVFVVSMAQAVKERDSYIANYREEQLRSEQVVALGTMAASATHELATPLSTMQLISDELDVISDPVEHAEQIKLMQQQLARCHTILGQLRLNTTELKHDDGENVNARLFFHDVVERWSVVRPEIEFSIEDGDLSQQQVKTHATLVSALMNLLDNAADASLDNDYNTIEINLAIEDKMVAMAIRNYGRPISLELLSQLGSVTISNKKNGMGIGFFLANTSIEKLNGQVSLTNLSSGVLTRVFLPVIEAQS